LLPEGARESMPPSGLIVRPLPFFDAKRDDPVERFVEEAPRHPVFKLIAGSAHRATGKAARSLA